MTFTFKDQEHSGFLSLAQIKDFLRYRAQEGDSGDIFGEDEAGVGYWEFANGTVELVKF